jgi:hypothetical protein
MLKIPKTMATQTAEELRKKNIKVVGDFVLKVDSGRRNLSLVVLEEIKNRGLQETGDLVFAIAPYSDYFGARAIIPEKSIPSDAVAYRIGEYATRNNHGTGDTEIYVPVAFYKK